MPNLTEKYIASLKPRESRKQYDVFDSKLSGFGLCYSDGGARTFFVFWRDSAGRSRRESVGRADKGMSVSEAREIAKEKLREAGKAKKAGIDAHVERKAPTLGDLIDRYLKHAPGRIAPSTVSNYEGTLRRNFSDELRAQKLTTFRREQMEDLHRKIGSDRGKVAANNWLRVARHMFYLAVDWKLVAANPCARIQLFPETERTRQLVGDEPARLDAALKQESDWRWRAFFPLLLLLGLRKSELLSLRWKQIDFAQRTVTIEKTKNGKKLTQPLIELVVQIFESLPSRGESEFVFPSPRGAGKDKELKEANHAWDRIRERAKLSDFRVHDLRHTFASTLLNSGVPLEVVSKACNHSSLQQTLRYAHLVNGTVRSAMERLAAALPAPELAPAPAPRVIETELVTASAE